MPKQRITKEIVISAAFELMREGGTEQVLVKNIARKIGCSVQPIYSYFSNMEGLRKDLEERAAVFTREYIKARIDKDDLFRSTGYAYVRLAREEPGIFKMYVLRQRDNIASLDGLYQSEANPDTAELIADALHISKTDARELHTRMLIFNVGIGIILTSTSPGIPPEEIAEQLETAYEAFLNQILRKQEEK